MWYAGQAIARLGQIMIQLGRHEAAQSMLQAAQKEHGSRPAAAAARADWASVASVLRDAEAGVRRRCPVDHFLLLGLPRTGCTDEQVIDSWRFVGSPALCQCALWWHALGVFILCYVRRVVDVGAAAPQPVI